MADPTPLDEMLDNLIVKLHARRGWGPRDLHADMHALMLVVQDTRGLARAALRRRDDAEARWLVAEDRATRIAVERDIAARERDAFKAEVANLKTIHAAETADLRRVLERAQTALYDAMHAGHLSREYAGSVIVEVERALGKGGIDG